MSSHLGRAAPTANKPNKPRMPAVVRKEMDEDDIKRENRKVGGADGKGKGKGKSQADDADDSRMQYRGFDKSKLNRSRKIERKEKRQGKKQARGEHSANKGKMKRLEEENRLLKQKIMRESGRGAAKQQGKEGAGKQQQSKDGKVGGKAVKFGGEESSSGKRKREVEEEAGGKQGQKKDTGKSKGKGQREEEGGATKKAKTPTSNFMKMIQEQGLDDEMAADADDLEIEKLQKRLGENWRGELAEDGLCDLWDALDNLGEDSGLEDFSDEEIEVQGEGRDEDEDEEDEDEEGEDDVEDVDGESDDDGGAGLVDDDDEDDEDDDDDDDDKEDEDEAPAQMSSKKGVAKAAIPPKQATTVNGESGVLAKYVPPALRDKMMSQGMPELLRKVKGCLNKLSEANLSAISDEMAEIYASYPQTEVHKYLADTVLELAGEGSGRVIDQFAALYAAFVASLHCAVGLSVGARFLEALCKRLADILGGGVSPEGGQEGKNLAKLLSHLFVFKVCDASLITEFADVLLEGFSLDEVDMLLVTLKACGPSLKHGDSTAFTRLIGTVRSRAAELGGGESEGRTSFLLDFIYELQGRKSKKGLGSSGEADEEIKRLSKFLRGYQAKTGSKGQVTVLRAHWLDLAKGKLHGPWWEQGARLTRVNMASNAEVEESGKDKGDAGEEAKRLRELASRQHMGSGVRKDIFTVMMSSEDFLDAFEKLLRLNLKDSQARELVRVAFHCCGQGQSFNPFYAHLIHQMCEHDKNHIFTLRLAFWDSFKEVDDYPKTKIANLAMLLAHVWGKQALSLSLLKPIEIERFGPNGILFLRLAFRALFSQFSIKTVVSLCDKISSAETETRELRVGLQWFMSTHMGGGGAGDKGKAIDAGVRAMAQALKKGKVV